MASGKRFYVYAHSDRQLNPFYVGKGTGNRASILFRKNRAYQAKVAEIGKENVVISIYYAESEQDAFDKEVELIAQMREEGIKLTNRYDGGEKWAARSGRKKTAQEIINHANSVRGIKHSPEWIEKVRRAHIGRKRSPETCKRISESLKGKKQTEERAEASRRVLREVSRKAAEWHSSPEGIEWHKQHGKKCWEGREPVMLICQNADCSKEYPSFFPTRSKYCCGNCKEQDRRRRNGKPVGVRPKRKK